MREPMLPPLQVLLAGVATNLEQVATALRAGARVREALDPLVLLDVLAGLCRQAAEEGETL
jgi:hypothetical protein